MESLNFPHFQFDLKKEDNKILIFDIIRRKHLILTPEEWVRQHLIHFLVFTKLFPRSLIKVESGLKYHKQSKRADLIVFDTEGGVLLLAECKAPTIEINESALFQIGIYQKSISPRYLLVTNGMVHLTWEKDPGKNEFNLIPEIPEYKDIS